MIQEKDGRYGWVVVCASFLIQFIGLGINFTFGLFYAEISKEFPLIGKRGVAWVPAIMGASAHVIGPLASILVNKFGHRTVTLLGSAFAAAGFAMSYFTIEPTDLYITIGVCAGIGLGLMYLPAVVILAKYFDTKLASASCIASAGSGTGTFCFGWTLTFLLAVMSWRAALLICGGIFLVTIPLGVLYLPFDLKKPEDGVDPWVTGLIEPEVKSWRNAIIDLNLFKSPLFLLFATAEFLTAYGYNVPHVYLPEIEQRLTGLPGTTLLAFIAFPMVLTRLSLGYFSRKQWLNKHLLYTLSLAVAGIATAISPHLDSVELLRLYCAIYGSSMGVYIGLKSAILVELLGDTKLTDAFGFMLLVQSTGMLFGAPIAGFLYDTFGTYLGGFYFAGAVFFASSVLVGLIPLTRRAIERRRCKILEAPHYAGYSTFGGSDDICPGKSP